MSELNAKAVARNPFMLMIDPERVMAAVEASERLKQLNRHECRPLDRALPGGADATGASAGRLVADDE